MKVFVFGSNGMLGRYVYSYFKSEGYDVIGLTRRDLDLTQASISNVGELLLSKGMTAGDVVINCAGLIKQRGDTKDHDFVSVNAIFPHKLNKVCVANECQLIHITTDCVYDGLRGGYNEYAIQDATDAYGFTKSIGEPSSATIIRTSIIGEELSNFSSLIEWVKSNKDKTVNGYINHRWNGITCLQFAKICQIIIDNSLYWEGVHHITSPYAVSKCELTRMISDVYDLNITVVPFETGVRCDRSLTSIYRSFPIPPLRDQLIEMKEFYSHLINEV